MGGIIDGSRRAKSPGESQRKEDKRARVVKEGGGAAVTAAAAGGGGKKEIGAHRGGSGKDIFTVFTLLFP